MLKSVPIEVKQFILIRIMTEKWFTNQMTWGDQPKIRCVKYAIKYPSNHFHALISKSFRVLATNMQNQSTNDALYNYCVWRNYIEVIATREQTRQHIDQCSSFIQIDSFFINHRDESGNIDKNAKHNQLSCDNIELQ